MTSFEDTTAIVPTTAPPVTPPPEPKPVDLVPLSRVFTDPKLWQEAHELSDMLTYCRPHLSRTESKFIAKFIFPLGVSFDKYGNIYKQIGDTPTVLWSSHTDTVHRVKGFQKIEYVFDKKTGEVFFQTAPKPRSSCLGADDTAGIWLMIQMIRANIPGLYIFHRGEEVGGKGSGWIADKNKTALNGIKFAIAFDRKNEKSIITYQRSKRSCSDEFAKSLAEQLGMGHECDTSGSFTDTASYVDLVAECTNVSVGYQNAHCWDECLNVDYLFRLRDALLKIDIAKLVEKRKPGENTSLWTSHNYSHENSYYRGEWCGWDGCGKNPTTEPTPKRVGGLTGFEVRKLHPNAEWCDLYEFDKTAMLWFPIQRKTDLGVTKVWNGKKSNSKRQAPSAATIEKMWPGSKAPKYVDMVRMIKLNPEIIADLLEMDGYGPIQILDHLLVLSETNTVHL